MIIHLNTHPDDRKEMVKAISQLTGLGSTYMGMPSCAYRIGAITVNRDGSIDYDSDAVTADLIPMLLERSWLDPAEYSVTPAEESPATDDSEETVDAPENSQTEETEEDAEEAPISDPTEEPTTMALHLPMEGFTIAQAKNLLRMVCKYQYLLRRMIHSDTLEIKREIVEDICAKNDYTCIGDIQKDLEAGTERGDVSGLSFEQDHFMLMFANDEQDPDRWKVVGELMDGMMRMAKAATRVSLDSKATPENEKFYAHSWLLRMGFGGPEHKQLRATLLGHLNGYTAFKTKEAMQAHSAKYTALRWERNRAAEENKVDEYLEDTAEWLGTEVADS